MESRRIFFLLLIVVGIPGFTYAKEIKPTMIVYGATVEAFAAAVQSARSNVPTLWVMDKVDFAPELTTHEVSIKSNDKLDGGIWMDLLMLTQLSKVKSDSIAQVAKHDIKPRLMLNAIEAILNKEQNLTVIKNGTVQSLVKTKKGWTAVLSNKKKFNVRVVVDASEGADLSRFNSFFLTMKPSRIETIDKLSADLIRTLVAVADCNGGVYGYTVKDLVSRSSGNFFSLQSLIQVARDEESIPLRISVGQAAGAAAAYCAFFKTTTDKIEVRKLQTELMTFGARLFPAQNISLSSVNFSSLQKMYLTGMFPLYREKDSLLFNGNIEVRIDEVKPLFNQLYSRSQLWFVDNTEEVFNLSTTLSLIKFVSFKGVELDKQIEKDWARKFKFSGEFSEDRAISREEFVVLADKYADPFSKTVTQDGTIVR